MLANMVGQLVNMCDQLHLINMFKDGEQNHRWHVISAVKDTKKFPALWEFASYRTTGATKLGAMTKRLSKEQAYITPPILHQHYQGFVRELRVFQDKHRATRQFLEQQIEFLNGSGEEFIKRNSVQYYAYLVYLEEFYVTWVKGLEAKLGTIVMFNQD
jgi:hypothetical protein